MAVATFEYRDESERISIERAIAFVTQMRDLALDAPDGQVLDVCEGQALENGRDLLRSTLQEAVQTGIDQREAKKGRPALARAGARAGGSGVAPDK